VILSVFFGASVVVIESPARKPPPRFEGVGGIAVSVVVVDYG
jgi:hypothetical protein